MSAGRTVNSLSQNWCTPMKYVKAIREMFNGIVELDPCSNEFSILNAKIEFKLPQKDGLKEEWDFKTIYVNPPYGADRTRGTTIKNWLKKCAEAHKLYKSEVLSLVPVATNTSHWKNYVFSRAAAICFLYDTRLKFIIDGSSDNKGAPMSCCMIYWGDNVERFTSVFIKFGAVIDIRNLFGKKIGDFKDIEISSLFDDQLFAFRASGTY